jgi:hypothetical protein
VATLLLNFVPAGSDIFVETPTGAGFLRFKVRVEEEDSLNKFPCILVGSNDTIMPPLILLSEDLADGSKELQSLQQSIRIDKRSSTNASS